MKSKRLKFYYRATIAVCLIFLAFGIGFTAYMVVNNKEKNENFFKETVENTRNIVTSLINSNIETLDGVAVTIGEMNVLDLQHLLPIIREINNRNSFFRMGFINADGKGDMVDLDGTIHRNMDFSDSDFYQKAIRGTPSLSFTLKDSFSDHYLNYYGVPVVIQGETVGVLAAAYQTDKLRQVLDGAMFKSRGFSNIVDSKGEYVVRSLNSQEITNIRELGDSDDQTIENIIYELSAGKENFVELKNYNKAWLVYLSLEIEDWFLIGIIEEDEINGEYYLILGMVILITSAMLIFLFLAYCMNRMQIKNESQLKEIAYKDSLLKIDNFTKFSMDTSQKLKEEKFQKQAFWYGDLDDFKIFNESFGYETGDNLLIEIAEMLKEISQPGELFCREYADHFTGIRYYQDSSELISWFEKLVEKLEHYEVAEHKSFRLMWSMGFYCAEKPEDLLGINEMYNRAKMAQKSIKQIKNIKYAFYSDAIRNQVLRENEIESRMKAALEDECFKVFVQPKTDLFDDNRIVGGEALVRWMDPEKGMINPGEFIPLFEKNGFIVPLDRFMFKSVCQWLQNYLIEGKRPIRISVNVSRLGIFQEDFVEYYTGMKKAYQIPDNMLELEFTESLAVEDDDLLRRRVVELQKAGFICSLDDFGSGYSSLNILKDLPIQVLKLDMLFFKKNGDTKKARIIVENVVHMAKQLNIRVVAEGVEEKEQVEILKKYGCDVIQGYIFSKPIPIQEFEILLEKDPKGEWGAGFKTVTKSSYLNGRQIGISS